MFYRRRDRAHRVLPLGGGHITNDIAIGLRTPLDEAEKIKRKYGCAMARMVDDDETMEVPSVGGRAPRACCSASRCRGDRAARRGDLRARAEGDRASRLRGHARRGVVLTGGATILEGMTELAEEVLGLPARRGSPKGVGGLVDVVRSPAYATGVGLVQYGVAQQGITHFQRGDADKRNVWQAHAQLVRRSLQSTAPSYNVVSTFASGVNWPPVRSGAAPRVRTQIRPKPPPPPPVSVGFGVEAGRSVFVPSRKAPVAPTAGGFAVVSPPAPPEPLLGAPSSPGMPSC